MTKNFLVTGCPGCGKTTVIERTVDLLGKRGINAGGIYCPEMRESGARVGFKIIDAMTKEEQLLAHVGFREGPEVGKYHVNVAAVDQFSERAIDRALQEADFMIIDEIAPMEIHSQGFKRAVTKALDSKMPVLAAVHQRTIGGFIGEIRARQDIQVFEVTLENRFTLHEKLAALIEVNATKK
jgi:nucleoside-triphosphatase